MLGAIPSDLYPYIDTQRFCELCVDGDSEIPAPDDLDDNVNAVRNVNYAQGLICEAARKGQQYSLQQLKDLVYAAQQENPQGEQIMGLISDLTWCRIVKRKRPAPGAPQGEYPECRDAQAYLDRLQKGERIFVLEGIPQRNELGVVVGVYGDAVPAAGLMETGSLTRPCDNPPQLWGCKHNRCGDNGGIGTGTDAAGGGCCG